MSRAAARITLLGYILLCEVRKEPRGGYALRRLFETTPLGIFSSSPGSIYPALKRLVDQGLIQARGTGRGGFFEITSPGNDIVAKWLAQPVSLEEVAGPIELCLVRFAFLQEPVHRQLAIAFVASLATAASARAAELTAFLDSDDGRALPLSGRLAVEHGVRSIQTTREWATDAKARLSSNSSGDEA